MRERLRAGKGKMGRKGEKGKVRDGKGKRGEKGERERAQPPRGGTRGEVKEWIGDRLKEEGEGRGEQGRPSNGE